MFKDAQKELKRLEELLEEEEEELPEDEFDDEYEDEEQEPEESDDFDQEEWEQIRSTLVFRSGAEKFRQQLAAQQAGSKAYNSDRTDTEPEDLEDEEPSGGKSLTGLVVLAVLLTLGIVAMVIWFLLRYLG